MAEQMTRSRTYVPYPIQSHSDYREHYGVRAGGIGGRLLGRDLNLNRYQAELLCDLLESAREAGREEGVEA